MKKLLIAVATLVAVSADTYAGNPDRAGSAGASHLLVNPWARSAGLSNSAMASVNGVEACFLNVAGLAFTKKTELIFTSSNYLAGTGIKINAAGFGQKLGESGALGLTVTNMNFGDLMITETDLPEGGIGSFTPNYTNIGLSYAKGFSNSIYGGITMRVITEAIYNVRAQGVAFDAGIRYVTGEKDNVRFGIALRNVGPPMRYRGDGLSATATISTGAAGSTTLTVDQRSEKYELPSLVNVGFAYDYEISETMKLTGNAQFTSNSFSRDLMGLGVDFGFRDRFILRGGYMWDVGVTSEGSDGRSSVFTGPSGGLTVQVPTGTKGTVLGIDYSYRVTNPFAGVHSLGLHITL